MAIRFRLKGCVDPGGNYFGMTGSNEAFKTASIYCQILNPYMASISVFDCTCLTSATVTSSSDCLYLQGQKQCNLVYQRIPRLSMAAVVLDLAETTSILAVFIFTCVLLCRLPFQGEYGADGESGVNKVSGVDTPVAVEVPSNRLDKELAAGTYSVVNDVDDDHEAPSAPIAFADGSAAGGGGSHDVLVKRSHTTKSSL